MGVVPRKAMAYNAMTRPRMEGSARSCNVELAVAMKAMDAAPMGKITTRATGNVGDTAKRENKEPEDDANGSQAMDVRAVATWR